MNKTNRKVKPIKNVMIAGGGRIGYYVAKQLEESDINVKIIERDAERCKFLSKTLSKVTCLHGDGSDRALLEEENVRELFMLDGDGPTVFDEDRHRADHASSFDIAMKITQARMHAEALCAPVLALRSTSQEGQAQIQDLTLVQVPGSIQRFGLE